MSSYDILLNWPIILPSYHHDELTLYRRKENNFLVVMAPFCLKFLLKDVFSHLFKILNRVFQGFINRDLLT